jgi:hypothetical protein
MYFLPYFDREDNLEHRDIGENYRYDQNDNYNCRINNHFLERGAREYQDVRKLSAISDIEDK